LGWVVQDQLPAVQRPPQPAEQREPLGAVLVHGRVVDQEPDMGLLGHVHGNVGVLEQLGGVAAVLGVDRDPDAGIQVEGHPADAEGLVERRTELVGDRTGPVSGCARQQDRELVPAQPGNRVGSSEGPAQPLADLDEQLVAMVVAEGVVDVLEPVQVQQQQRRGAQVAVGGPDGLAHAVGEQLPVGQPGKRVVQGLADQPPLVTHNQQQEHAKGGQADRGRGEAGQPQVMLTASQLGKLLGDLLLLAVGERPDLVLQRGVGRMDRPLMDPPGQRRIASIHRGQHPSQLVDALGVLGLDLPGRGCVIRLAMDDQVVQGGGERQVGFSKRQP
jgi:hypothetical protein